MVETSLNLFDLIVLVVVGLSALLSFFRGFIREVLSLGAWVGASIVTLYAFPHVAEWIQPQVKSEMVASGLAAMGTFMVALILISLVSGTMLKYVKSGSDVGIFDNMLGLAFGVARGVLLLAIGYFVMSVVMRKENYPDWVKTAKSRPYVEQASEWLAEVAPGYLKELSSSNKKDKDADTKETDTKKPKVTITLPGDSDDEDSDDDASSGWQSLDELKRKMQGNN